MKEEDIPAAKPWALTGHKNQRERNAINSVFLQQEVLEDFNMNVLAPKYEKAKKELPEAEIIDVEGAEVVFVSYGSTSRMAREAMEILKEEGIKVGLIRPKTLWPFPDFAFEQIGESTKHVIAVELSMGQMMQDVKLALNGRIPVSLINKVGGVLLDPEEIAERTKKIMEVR